MVIKSIQTNYHSYLSGIKGDIDPIIKTMRNQNGERWRGKAWKGPVKTVSGYFKQAKLLKGISWTTLPIIGPIAAGVTAGNYAQWPLWIGILAALALMIIIYYLLVQAYIHKMAAIGQPEFHVEAFKAKRPREYEQVWAPFVKKDDFTFEGLYNLVNAVFSQHDQDPSSVAYVVAYSQSQHDFMQTSIAELKSTITEQEAAIATLKDELVESDSAVYTLTKVLKAITENQYRYVNDALAFTDLDFISGFSLYRQEGNTLKLMMDKGTTGKKRDLDLESDQDFAAVAAAKDMMGQAYSNNPYPGRHVVAFRMDMLEEETWVWCFHFDDDDERALSLILDNDIIESRQIRRVIHAFCLTIQKRMLSQKEVDLDAGAQ
ncbi:hypothetical protein [Paenibacillus lignilyticus]|uniref:DUF3137 domain-containing protein n=1 Tax=Paenibacillus lignilyticus TaxID=1172615 RepID=A0ABS5CA36_9BACL|nr:hypothetical protein [Paenibacillus lignilyticus]MBP3962517.1 hypothetical protein [Paenibacillus lignilyticus]